ncbi:BRO-N domain-containing protein [Gordonibacter pamelaeae]|uniref:BRO-N domain-containing protein n=1 Tax=Gordonibacter pamelaeae TaxID=471189 RepID=UPI001D07D790|nr:Bro-N domain-containing protein [Gordonibacter pamelaeae]MCB6311217.1 Bro-N domain-containing protein [Gordonibacter pamelaeae]
MVDSSVKLFESQEIRSAWNEDEEEWYFSIVDVVGALTESQDGRKYWNKLKQRLKDEGNETVTNCHQLKLKAADGKMRLTDVATTEQILRIVQSIPSKKAELFKLWLAQVGSERIDEIIDPELTLDRALETYLKKGYDRNWVNQRLQTIQVRKGLTDEWERRGVEKGKEYAILTDEITRAWSGMTTRQYKDLKDLKKENLRDNMTTLELVLNTLAEVTTTEFSKASQPEGFEESRQVAREGGSVAGAARAQIEARTGKPVTTSEKARDFANLIEDVLETDYELTEGTGEPEGD